MPAVADRSCWRSWFRVVMPAALAAAVAGCSADTTRFGYSNPGPSASRNAAPGEYTGSVRGAPASPIASQSLPPPTASRPTSIASSGVSGGSAGFGSYAPRPTSTSMSAPLPVPLRASAPRDFTGSVPQPTSAANVHVVAPGETLMSISRRYHKPLSKIAAANRIAPDTRLRVGDRITIPGVVAARHAPQPVVAAAAPRHQPTPAPVPQTRVASAEATSTARVATAAVEPTERSGTAGAPAFRWPVRGRVITSFGPKANGQQSDGIDLAVPEGTAVRAAEDGVVAYAGNELKGYGNLILIRHGDGFVTAYAHASEIMVKRNDTVRRGQVIAKSGQTGNVTSPQLHFEIRKGSSPVDPAQFLPSGA